LTPLIMHLSQSTTRISLSLQHASLSVYNTHLSQSTTRISLSLQHASLSVYNTHLIREVALALG